MTPFLQFRLWLRRGPAGERLGTAIVGVLLLALVAWAVVPLDDDNDGEQASPDAGQVVATEATDAVSETSTPAAGTEAPSPGAAPATAPAGAAPRAAARTGAAATAATPTAGPATAAAGACSGVTASDQGITRSEIFVAVPLVNLGGDVGNETFGIRADLEAVAQATAAGINDEGGVACRKMRVKTYRVNPLDRNEQRARCLEIVQEKPFAIIDFAAYLDPVARSCFPEHKLPYEGNTSMTEAEAAGAFPYMYSLLASTDRQFRNWVFEAAARGLFDPQKGFRKLGILINACNPKVNDELKQNLAKVGVGEDKTSTFTLSCATINPPSEIGQALFQHRNRDDVSHVLLAAPVGNGQNYVRQADGLGWKPVYTATDFGSVTNGSTAKDWSDGFANTVAITSTRFGEFTSGIANPQVARCQSWMRKANVRPPTSEGDAALALCDTFRLFVAVANAAGANPTRPTLLNALPKVGRIETTNWGDALFDRPGKLTGGDFIRPIQWHLDCKCWKVVSASLKPGH